ncbi:MAG TPA: FAD-binding oxidoreductase [Herpetosiphonaceae bacterium]
MMVDAETLQADLRALVGAEHVRPATAADAIDGVPAQVVVEPGDAAEVAAVLRLARDAGLSVAPRGGGSKLGWGNPPRRVDLILSTRRLDRVVEHAWADMTATVQAGCTVAQLQRVLAEHGQRLALDPLWPATATIGGILATNDSGALRARFGTLRDLVLGVTIALPDGTLARSGGKVVKNVAGYDLPKLMTGALGTLGVITEATFRLYPLPSHVSCVRLSASEVSALHPVLLRVLDSTLAPSGVQLHARQGAAPALDLRFEGIAAALDAQLEQLARLAPGIASQPLAPEAWPTAEPLWDDADLALICKASVLPAQLDALVQTIRRVSAPLRLSWELLAQAAGVGWLRLAATNEQALLAALSILRAEVGRLHGSLAALHAPSAVKARLDVWGADESALPLMRRVKEQFDPQRVLNPGRFVGGI